MNCLLCGDRNALVSSEKYLVFTRCCCPVCGTYILDNDIANSKDFDKGLYASYLYDKATMSKNSKLVYAFLTKEHRLDKSKIQDDYLCVDKDDVVSDYPILFTERINRIISRLCVEGDYFGKKITVDYNKLKSILFIKDKAGNGKKFTSEEINEQCTALLLFLKSEGYITTGNGNGIALGVNTPFTYSLTGKALSSINQSFDKYNKKIFVSMEFKNTDEIRNAIKNGIQKAGYSAELIDEIIHNRQIVPEMLRLIRSCRLLIMDATYPNNGAYYEAGYADGNGKEVIICCRKSEFNSISGKHSEDSTESIHFDIAQKQLLIWDNLEDLSNKLEKWIRSLLG